MLPVDVGNSPNHVNSGVDVYFYVCVFSWCAVHYLLSTTHPNQNSQQVVSELPR